MSARAGSEADDVARRWIRAWKSAGPALERVRRDELPKLDGHAAIALLTGPADYTIEPRRARDTSGLIEQQRCFAKARSRA